MVVRWWEWEWWAMMGVGMGGSGLPWASTSRLQMSGRRLLGGLGLGGVAGSGVAAASASAISSTMREMSPASSASIGSGGGGSSSSLPFFPPFFFFFFEPFLSFSLASGSDFDLDFGLDFGFGCGLPSFSPCLPPASPASASSGSVGLLLPPPILVAGLHFHRGERSWDNCTETPTEKYRRVQAASNTVVIASPRGSWREEVGGGAVVSNVHRQPRRAVKSDAKSWREAARSRRVFAPTALDRLFAGHRRLP